VTRSLGVGRQALSRLCVSLARVPSAAIAFFAILGLHLAAQSPPPVAASGTPAAAESADDSAGQQTKRILGMVPNFTAVSANTQVPQLSVKQKFWLATEGSFDYSSFISIGLQSAIEQATNTYPEFHQGAAAYARYYWHTCADAAVENYLVGAIIPAITREDPRYYTLYRGGFFRRTGYAISRLWITRNDRGGETFNFSEILGSIAAAEVSSRYYPREERTAGEIVERWASQFLNDGISNVTQEFWPDINHKFFHRH
jgi:lysozyme family protein